MDPGSASRPPIPDRDGSSLRPAGVARGRSRLSAGGEAPPLPRRIGKTGWWVARLGHPRDHRGDRDHGRRRRCSRRPGRAPGTGSRAHTCPHQSHGRGGRGRRCPGDSAGLGGHPGAGGVPPVAAPGRVPRHVLAGPAAGHLPRPRHPRAALPLRPAGSRCLARPASVGVPLLVPVATLTARLVGVLYALVPQAGCDSGQDRGRCDRRGGRPGRLYLAIDTPTGIVVAVVIGVTIPLAARVAVPRRGVPGDHRRGRSTIWTLGDAGEAIRRALQDQLGVVVDDVQSFGLAGSAGSTPCRSRLRGTRTGGLPSCTPRATCGPTAPTSSAGSRCTGGWRTRSRSTPSAGWCSRKTMRWR